MLFAVRSIPEAEEAKTLDLEDVLSERGRRLKASFRSPPSPWVGVTISRLSRNGDNFLRPTKRCRKKDDFLMVSREKEKKREREKEREKERKREREKARERKHKNYQSVPCLQASKC